MSFEVSPSSFCIFHVADFGLIWELKLFQRRRCIHGGGCRIVFAFTELRLQHPAESGKRKILYQSMNA
ncbi:hypothetical protein V2J09_013469 [Rumex salicifolius]